MAFEERAGMVKINNGIRFRKRTDFSTPLRNMNPPNFFSRLIGP